jgi:protein TIF31
LGPAPVTPGGILTPQIHTQEQVQDVRQSIIDQQYAMQYTCFHLEHNGERISDYIEISDVPNLESGSTISLVEDPYTEKEARLHIIRVRELIGAAGDRSDAAYGISAGASLLDAVTDGTLAAPETSLDNVENYNFEAGASLKSILPLPVLPPKTIRSLSLSPWNPPPYHLKNKGHLMYLVVVNLDGEQFHITSHLSGFYVNRSSHNKFDPSPKSGPKPYKSHSLLTLLREVDPCFNPAFQELLEHNSKREPLSMYLLTNALPANPWLIPSDSTTLVEHKPDITRTQESFLFGGTENNESLRDWNEEFQTTRELPSDSITDKIFRERLTSKVFADFTDTAAKGAALVARGEITPLNPTEEPDTQIFVYSNVFYSFGADGMGTFATEGGDHAARYATRKDANGVRAVNQLDIPGLFTAATAIIDYCGRRILGQSIVPGIFKQREPGDSIDYGAVEGKDIIAAKPEFVEPFKALSKAFFVKKHPVWDKEGKRHDLEASLDTKGMLGTDGRKYVLDLYRLTPLDVAWIEQYWGATPEEREDKAKDYPHRMAVLRIELVNAYRLHKLRERLSGEAKDNAQGDATTGKHNSDSDVELRAEANGQSEERVEKANGESEDAKDAQPAAPESQEDFTFSLNPDVFSGLCPQTEEEKEQMAKDEADVRAVCEYLTSYIIPTLLQQIEEGDITFPLDGASLTTMLHKRGINVRYLGHIAAKPDKGNHRLQALRRLATQEMVARAFKHVAGSHLRQVPHSLASSCAAHLLNCLLGSRLNPNPVAETDEAIKSIYANGSYSFETVTPDALRASLVDEVRRRFRFDVEGDLVQPGREMQMLREVALKLGLQLASREYHFEPVADEPVATGPPVNGNGTAGKKKRKGKDSPSPSRADHVSRTIQSFHADDVVNFVPLVRDAAPKVSQIHSLQHRSNVSSLISRKKPSRPGGSLSRKTRKIWGSS